jgi:hypothetical protein
MSVEFDLTKNQILFERDFEDATGNGQAHEDFSLFPALNGL